MKASLPVMFIAPLLAVALAHAEPQERSARYPANGEARSGREAGHGDRQQGQSAYRAEQSSPRYPAYAHRPSEARRPDSGAASANPRGSGWGGTRQLQPDNAPQRRDYGNAQPSRDTGRDRGFASQRPSTDAGRSPRGDRPYRGDGDGRYNDRGGHRDERPQYDNSRYDRPGNSHHDGHDEHHHNWRDDRGRTWDHDHDWYDHYHADHFSYYGDRYYARQRFSIGFYSAPWGYRTHLWGYGDRLPSAYYDGRYVIDNYYDYDLYAPPFATEWVRVGNDVLLIDMQDGEVLDVIADLFW